MPNDAMTNTTTSTSALGAGTSNASTGTAPASTTPTSLPASANPLGSIASPGTNTLTPSPATPGVSPPTPNPLSSPNPVIPSPSENAFDISRYGGQEKLDAAMSFYNKLAANEFDSTDFLRSIAQVSPDRFNAINRTVLENYLPDIQQNLIENLAQDPELKVSALQSLGWDPQDYEAYQNYQASGQTERLQPVSPEVKALRDKVNSFEQAQQQALYEQTMQTRQSDYSRFRDEFTQPVNDFIQKMNLPDTKEGNLAKAILKGATDHLFEGNKEALNLANTSFQAFMSGNGQLARTNNAYALRAAVQQHAQEVATYLGDLIHKASLYDQMQSQPGLRRDPLTAAQAAPTSQRQPTFAPNGSNGQSATGSPFDPDYVMQRVNAKLGL